MAGLKLLSNLLKKGLDKSPFICYNTDTNKGKELINMKEHWMSKSTGEVVFTHKEAMELYRQGHEIEYWSWSDVAGEMLHRVDWVH